MIPHACNFEDLAWTGQISMLEVTEDTRSYLTFEQPLDEAVDVDLAVGHRDGL